MSTTDLPPAAGTFRPLFERLASIVGLEEPRDSTDDNEFDASELTEAELMYGEKDAVKTGQPLMERDIE